MKLFAVPLNSEKNLKFKRVQTTPRLSEESWFKPASSSSSKVSFNARNYCLQNRDQANRLPQPLANGLATSAPEGFNKKASAAMPRWLGVFLCDAGF